MVNPIGQVWYLSLILVQFYHNIQRHRYLLDHVLPFQTLWRMDFQESLDLIISFILLLRDANIYFVLSLSWRQTVRQQGPVRHSHREDSWCLQINVFGGWPKVILLHLRWLRISIHFFLILLHFLTLPTVSDNSTDLIYPWFIR